MNRDADNRRFLRREQARRDEPDPRNLRDHSLTSTTHILLPYDDQRTRHYFVVGVIHDTLHLQIHFQCDIVVLSSLI